MARQGRGGIALRVGVHTRRGARALRVYHVEPEYSAARLSEFEQRYGVSSSLFYALYSIGIMLVPADVAAEWAFEYRVNAHAQEFLSAGAGTRDDTTGGSVDSLPLSTRLSYSQ